jgi:Domain of unknown function (DUF4156)
MKKFAFVLTTGLILSACNFVKVTETGSNVAVSNSAAVQGCSKVSVLTVKTRDNYVGSMKRSPETIVKELTNLARNDAMDAGGDTIVPINQPVDGRQSFDVYRCGN